MEEDPPDAIAGTINNLSRRKSTLVATLRHLGDTTKSMDSQIMTPKSPKLRKGSKESQLSKQSLSTKKD